MIAWILCLLVYSIAGVAVVTVLCCEGPDLSVPGMILAFFCWPLGLLAVLLKILATAIDHLAYLFRSLFHRLIGW